VIFDQIRSGGCLSYLVGCDETRAAAVVDPDNEKVDHYVALAAQRGLRIRYVIDTHTHADHFSGAREISARLGVPAVMHCAACAPYTAMRVEDGECIVVGRLRVRVLHSPGHTDDSMCLVLPDRVLTGDTLLIGGAGRTDLPTGDPETLHHSLFERVLKLDGSLAVFPAHDYAGRSSSTIAQEMAHNPRLQKRDRKEFVDLMRGLDLAAPQHLTEALRTNRYGGRTVAQLIAEASNGIPFMAMQEALEHVERSDGTLTVVDVREHDEYAAGHIPGAIHIPRGQLELRVDRELPDPTRRIVTCCRLGKISTLAAATLRSMGYTRVVALDGGLEAWSRAGYPLVQDTH
jgi:glyoxylase-like metal-dependent hydrolase (beta-lactamase superfamily II)/rhodanese-related sulfurtransferase